MNENTVIRAKQVKALVDEHHEPGRQDRCKKWVYRVHVRKLYPMSLRTFWRMLKIAAENEK